MKCIQLVGTGRCENDAALGSNYCPVHMLSASDLSGGPERGVMYSRLDESYGNAADAPSPADSPMKDDPFTEG